MAKVAKGQYVSFTRAHDRAHALEGYVVEVTDSEVLIETEPDGVLTWACADDVTVLAEPIKAADEKAAAEANSTNGEETKKEGEAQ